MSIIPPSIYLTPYITAYIESNRVMQVWGISRVLQILCFGCFFFFFLYMLVWVPSKMPTHSSLRSPGLTHRCVTSTAHYRPPARTLSVFYSFQIFLGRQMSGNHSPTQCEVTQPSLEVNHALWLKAEQT